MQRKPSIKISRKTIEKVALLEKIRIIILDHLKQREIGGCRLEKQLFTEKKKERFIISPFEGG